MGSWIKPLEIIKNRLHRRVDKGEGVNGMGTR